MTLLGTASYTGIRAPSEQRLENSSLLGLVPSATPLTGPACANGSHLRGRADINHPSRNDPAMVETASVIASREDGIPSPPECTACDSKILRFTVEKDLGRMQISDTRYKRGRLHAYIVHDFV